MMASINISAIIFILLVHLLQAATVSKLCAFTNASSPCHCVPRVRRNKMIQAGSDCCCVGISSINRNMTENLVRFTLVNATMERISSEDFLRFRKLEEIYIRGAVNLRVIEGEAISNKHDMQKVMITDCHKLERISGILLKNQHEMDQLKISRTGLREMPRIEMMEKRQKDRLTIDLADNEIESIPEGSIQNVIADLKLTNNKITHIERNAISGKFSKISIDHNPTLTHIHDQAFVNVTMLEQLVLSFTSIKSLPTAGIRKVKKLELKDVETLKILPGLQYFENLKNAEFTYPHHCCLFKHPNKEMIDKTIMEQLLTYLCKSENGETVRRRRAIQPNRVEAREATSEEELDVDISIFENRTFALYGTGEGPPVPEGVKPTCLQEEMLNKFYERLQNVTCSPQPDEMNPCENIVGHQPLRLVIWFIWTCAIVFNVIAWIMLAWAYEARKRGHYTFMFNLLIANCLSAVYLGFLAVQDQMTADEYFRFAVGWQTGMGCAVAGFLCVFSSLLSIFCLFFIAFEIAYSTRNAIYGKHLPYRVCVGCVLFAYVFSAVMAALPLFGVSSYSTTSTCLPLHMETAADKVYILFGLAIIVIAFVGMAVCYASIYSILTDPNTPSRDEDHHIILKMLLLIATDFICWVPSTVVGLATALGYRIISISTAKIFIVCFFPVNAFTNPFLYVFLTKVIQAKLKKRALPILRRLTTTPVHTIYSLSNLYHASGPAGHKNSMTSTTDKRRRSAESIKGGQSPSPQHTHHTHTTWVTDDSREGRSEEQACLLDDTRYLSDRMPNTRRSTPRVSFQADSIIFEEGTSGEERSRGPSPIPPPCTNQRRNSRRGSALFKKIATAPEVSDVSEHSADSHHEHCITHPSVVLTRAAEGRMEPVVHSTHSHNHCRYPSSRQDSGRSSLASIFNVSNRSDTDSAFSETLSEVRSTGLLLIPALYRDRRPRDRQPSDLSADSLIDNHSSTESRIDTNANPLKRFLVRHDDSDNMNIV